MTLVLLIGPSVFLMGAKGVRQDCLVELEMIRRRLREYTPDERPLDGKGKSVEKQDARGESTTACRAETA